MAGGKQILHTLSKQQFGEVQTCLPTSVPEKIIRVDLTETHFCACEGEGNLEQSHK